MEDDGIAHRVKWVGGCPVSIGGAAKMEGGKLREADKHIVILVDADARENEEPTVLVSRRATARRGRYQCVIAIVTVVGGRIFDARALGRYSRKAGLNAGIHLPPLNSRVVVRRIY